LVNLNKVLTDREVLLAEFPEKDFCVDKVVEIMVKEGLTLGQCFEVTRQIFLMLDECYPSR
jgi:hypothetical protein